MPQQGQPSRLPLLLLYACGCFARQSRLAQAYGVVVKTTCTG